jgi:hypothetical protein
MFSRTSETKIIDPIIAIGQSKSVAKKIEAFKQKRSCLFGQLLFLQ